MTRKKAKPELDPVADASVFMFGEMRDCLLNEMKAMPEVWQKMSQSQQDEAIGRIDTQVARVIWDAATRLAAHNYPTIKGEVDQVLFKEGIKAVIKVQPGDPMRHELADSKYVNVVIIDADQFMGGGEITSDPDQQDLANLSD